MPSSITWLDHDAAAAGRSLRMLSLFKQPESRDELGIGGIRDAISDQLFPGTSTIQTRLRYVFFIPWLFGQLDAKKVSASNFPGAAREAENKLLAALIANVPANAQGIIGRDAGSALKRTPSSVYWAGLSTWGLRRHESTIAQYFSQADIRRAERHQRRASEEGSVAEGRSGAWHPRLQALCPDGFPESAQLDLEKDEAEFLLDRWRLECPDSLLTWLAMDMARMGAAASVGSDRIWEHPRLGEFPESLRQLTLDAQRFDSLIHGAALLYNLQLAELEDQAHWVAQHGAALKDWHETQAGRFRSLDLAAFWPRVLGKGHSISLDTQRFIEEWRAVACAPTSDIAGSSRARTLVELRERKLKGERSRFRNQGARKQWGGAAGLVPLSYRWPITRSFLGEWHAGWSLA